MPAVCGYSDYSYLLAAPAKLMLHPDQPDGMTLSLSLDVPYLCLLDTELQSDERPSRTELCQPLPTTEVTGTGG